LDQQRGRETPTIQPARPYQLKLKELPNIYYNSVMQDRDYSRIYSQSVGPNEGQSAATEESSVILACYFRHSLQVISCEEVSDCFPIELKAKL
jgi:hypothetical protein